MRLFATILAPLLVPVLLGAASLPGWAVDDSLSPAANQIFIAANARKAGVISRPSGLQYRLLRSGFGKRPGPTDLVQVFYSGSLINGTVFDGTSPGLPATLAVNGVLPGLAEALSLMHEGDRWQLVIPPNLAFGVRGASNGAVPPGQVVVFDVTLVSSMALAKTEAETASPFSVYSAGREQGAMLTLHP
jgi:hypothetical protein